ncbi:hypothetical protein H6G54_28555 [Anabaena cylindrica FACHB-243]|nr:hypothetical protein [Anabaena cylindrica FACHB-243]MBY5285840.1 hypothetical protein [Anabaena sp. CCAP 1446/1C]MBY5311821.1 hypothetical protein [Anabaena sp. CCAP 1446/1C]
MTQNQVFRVALADIKANAQQKLEQYIDKQADTIAPFALNYSFDYNQFAETALQNKAKTTLANFIGFVRQTFDGLLASGKALQDLYYDCLAFCPNGKQVFHTWLESNDFGASRYIASSAMKIYTWFDQLPERIQRLVREKVQNWSVAALSQLTKVAHHLIKELVDSGKKTAAQVKATTEKTATSAKKTNSTIVATASNERIDAPELAPGMRIVVVVNGDWKGYKGIITAKWKANDNESWWVLLDHVVAQGSFTKTLFKPEQIQLEVLSNQSGSKTSPKETFTARQVEQKIAEALAEQEREQAEVELARFTEIRDAALQAAAVELKAAQEHAQKMAQDKEKLIEQLIEKDRQLVTVQNLSIKNQQLEQRVVQLEKALERAGQNSWQNTFSGQAATVVNSELEATIAPLMSEVERLNEVVLTREQEVAQLKAVNHKQQAELTNIVNLITNTNEMNSNQTEIVEQFVQLKTLLQEMKINEVIT